MRPTFAQLIAALVCVACLASLIVMYFFPAKGGNQEMIVGAVMSGFTGSLGFFIGTTVGSMAKDESQRNTTNNLVSALSNSQPITPKEPIQPTPDPAQP